MSFKPLIAISVGLAGAFLAPSARVHAQAARPIPGFKTEFIVSTDSGVFANIFAIHMLSGGSILAVDATMRRMLVVDSSLKSFKVVADTTGNAPTIYGNSSGGLVSYVGDSAAFLDQASKSLITIDRNGKFGHITSMPNVNDMFYLAGPAYGKAGFDVKGRLFYRSVLQERRPAVDSIYTPPDTAPVLRADLDARRIDTIGWVHVLAYKERMVQIANTITTTASIVNPYPLIDDWAFDRDGTVAIIRGSDYHIDWILPDGSKKSTPPMAFDRRRITDIEKRQTIDSVRRMADSARAVRDSIVAAQAVARGGRGGGGSAIVMENGQRIAYTPPPPMFVKPEELPDFIPALKSSSRPRFDLEGNLWVVPATAVPLTPAGGLLYDVIDRTGTVIKRVQLPPGRILSNFGPKGIVYLIVPTTSGWTRIERVRLVGL